MRTRPVCVNTDERWRATKELFGELFELDAPARAVRLAATPDRDLAREVAALLEAADTLGNRFEAGAGWQLPEAAPLIGMQLGPWRIVREIGRGGMGAVFEAEREEPFRMRAALKIAGTGQLSSDGVRRFAQERQVLAGLQHRNIAGLLDGGVTPDGTPYLVMEYIDGRPLDEHCDIERLGIRPRLELFRQVCDAVHFAHQHLVVHRDLKPRNILVDQHGTVKLLDFGVAKLLAADAAEITRGELLPLTPAYAAPEQLRGEPISTSSDVFALGVVLHELLTGERPFGREVAERLADTRTPLLPSARVHAARLARLGNVSLDEVQRALTGDLDAIVLMTLRAEPERRYPSALALAEDLSRHLSGHPVVARPDTLGYRFGKTLRRHRTAAIMAGVAVLALVGGAATSLMLAAEARAERDRAVLEAARTRGVTQFFQDVFAAASPDQLGSGVTVVAALDHAIPRIDSSFADNPDLRAAIKNSLGSTLLNMFQAERARPLAEDALRTLDSLGALASERERADALYNLAGVEATAGSLERADSLYTASIAAYWRVPGIDSAEVWRGVGQHAGVVASLGRLDEAVHSYTEVVARLAQLAPHDSVARSIAETNLATALSQLGRYEEAEPRFRHAIALLGDGEGAKRHRVAAALQPWAGTLNFLGRSSEAEEIARRSWQMNRALFGADQLPTIVSLRMLINVLADASRCPDAIAMATELLMHRAVLPAADPSVGTALMYAGWCRAQLGDQRRGERDAREALQIRREQFPEGHWAIAQAESMLGDVLARGGAPRRAEARDLLQRGYDGLRSQLDSTNVRVRQARDRMNALGPG
jgi:serine/threonine protein kinase/tetratricopeptide (TPR) repeat protein